MRQSVLAVVQVLERIEQLVRQTPPVENGKSRFGNPAFRDFYDKVQQVEFRGAVASSLVSFVYSWRPRANSADCARVCICQAIPEWHSSLPGMKDEYIVELGGYLQESWGNRTRVDYGSGMELNFICWLSVLARNVVVPGCTHTHTLTRRPSWNPQTVLEQARDSHCRGQQGGRHEHFLEVSSRCKGPVVLRLSASLSKLLMV
jgi:serine/threonine-protein phosphatase 2A activator